MARGGVRTGTPGKSYGNRTDLNKPSPSAQYGQGVAQQRAMQALPVAPPPAPPRPNVPAPVQTGLPDPLVPIDAPTGRPNEPLTAGAPVGAGPGPEALVGGLGSEDPLVERIRQLYMLTPTEELREILEELDG